ncbi:hypothetical protein LWC34_49465 [Kibdelosporangium philippinense]|uniref:Pirin C-terminal domain-containing protein n=1 Tax=Kibdelosporangium philippinense TaxID=211113 RepID=A0ABS8ZW26_9PSEU|nr:pirin-like C-terminal cupin domain-containing protein [Kibdelosporangium philippinense]MCE7010781.1 hypothetical protein [Kibdelosporangium philippinense]
MLTLKGAASQPAAEPNLDVLLLGGLPIREPVVRYCPFAMTTREEIFQALQDFQSSEFGVIPGEHIPHT